MKKLILSATVAFTVLTTSNIYAQQGFGTNTPDRSSAVDIVSNKRGLLIPRLELTKTTEAGPVVKPENALFVYNKASVNDVTPGFYYWEAANVANAKEQGLGRWVRFVSSNSGSAVTVSAGDNVTVKDTKIGHDTNYEVSVKGGTAPNQVLVTKKDGDNYITEWVNPEEFIIGVNGVTAEKVGDEVHVGLGGDLSKPTEIKTTEKNTLAISGLDKLDGTAGKEFDATSQNIVIMGTDGILKVVTPKALIDDAIDNGDIDGKALTSKGNSIQIEGTAAATALLKDVNIEVKGGDKAGQVLVTKEITDSEGKVTHVTEWVDASALGNTVKSGQGITVKDDNTVNLGGKIKNDGTTPGAIIDLTDDTSHKVGDIAIKGLEELVGKDATTGNKLDSGSDKLVIADKDGVLKQTSAKNLIEDAIEKGTDGTDPLKAKTLKGDGITVTSTGAADTTLEVANSLLKDVTLGIADGAVTSDKMKATVVDGTEGSKNADKGMIPVAGDNGTVTYQQVTGELLNGKALKSESIVVTGGAKALLDETSIEIKGGEKAGQVLVTKEVKDAEGTVTGTTTEWVDASDLGNTVKSGQGITVKSDNTVNLGGEITEPTKLDLTGNGSLAITGLNAPTDKNTVLENVKIGADGKLYAVNKSESTGSITINKGGDINIGGDTNYSINQEEVVIEVTLGNDHTNLTLPTVNGTEGQTISIKIVNTTEEHEGYLNIKSTDGDLAYGAMPFQGWIIKSNGTKWIVVGRN
ncbi:hypothetical protein [Myroides odoratimimus]|uniref:hypothetical protein n=1 Tax=Myroides odoratimimus TaxID=76832 RepID=UPI002575778D|nr:hypothetical protein [Myroides odoratimimus]MDM1454723.1 hypothetical protein [Myroides odoratimimus]MDM1478441.1 hypothetical protein [Myroides odoratimimus]MDM1490723.1 hypothetical protein [Myroides odoratimimus]